MSMTTGQDASATNFNEAFLSRKTDSDTVAKVGLKNTDPASGSLITNLQRAINKIYDTLGLGSETDANAKAYGSENFIADGDDRKVAIGKLDQALKAIEDQVANTVGTDTYFVLENNSSLDLTGFVFDPAEVLSFEVSWTVYRETTGVGANRKVQRGSYMAVRNDAGWSDAYGPMTPMDGGVSFETDDDSGQLRAVTDNQAGTYDGTKSYLVISIKGRTLVQEEP